MTEQEQNKPKTKQDFANVNNLTISKEQWARVASHRDTPFRGAHLCPHPLCIGQDNGWCNGDVTRHKCDTCETSWLVQTPPKGGRWPFGFFHVRFGANAWTNIARIDQKQNKKL